MKIIFRRRVSGRLYECGNNAGKLVVNGRRAAVKCRSVKKSIKRAVKRSVRRSRRASRRASRRI